MSVSGGRILAPRSSPLKSHPPSGNGASGGLASDPSMAPTAHPPHGYGTGPRPAWLDVDWESYEHQAQVRGQRVNYVDVGEGPAIVLLHGWFGRWQHWLDTIEPLAHQHRVIAVDLPGFGRSALPPDGASIPVAAAILLDLLTQLGIESFTLAGSSMGGGISVEAALQAPDRVEGLVLVAATGLADGYVGLPKAFLTHPLVVRSNELILRESNLPKRSAARIAARPRLR
jgi:pimeloyl-ACP methyl ester carboxylesterase